MKLSALIEKQPRRGVWLYGLCLVLYILYVIMLAAEMAPPGAPVASFLPLLVPAVIIISQLVYPTLLAWLCIFVGFVFYTCAGVCCLQWPGSALKFVLGLIMLTILISVCLGLLRLGLGDS
jgi:hypothetical protein